MSKAKATADAPAEPRATFTRNLLENVECLAIAVVMALILKFFLLEAYKIPTGSMQPTIIGDEQTGVFDRVLVNKMVYFLREPRRYEVVVFRMPLVQRQNYIKRLIGRSGETITIRNGDVFVTPPGGGAAAIARKPEHVWRSVRKELPVAQDGGSRFRPDGGDATVDGATLRLAAAADAPARATLQRDEAIDDDYFDGYPTALAASMSENGHGRRQRRHNVSDVEIGAEVTATEACRTLQVILEEPRFRHVLEFDRRAGQVSLRSYQRDGGEPALEDEAWTTVEGAFLPAGEPVSVTFRNMDDELRLVVDGEEVARRPYTTVGIDPIHPTLVSFEATGGEVTLDEVELYRDIHYLPDGAGSFDLEASYEVPEGHYFVMGDNTQNSHDCRQWEMRTYTFPDGTVQQGHSFDNPLSPDANPRVTAGGLVFQNIYGQTYRFPNRADHPSKDTPFHSVPGEFLLGKALAVFWPIPPFSDVWRLKWVR